MLRLSRARVIGDIEMIVNRACPARGLHRWTARGADCTVERHSFSGAGYGFQSEILKSPPFGLGASAGQRVLAARRRRGDPLDQMAEAFVRQEQ